MRLVGTISRGIRTPIIQSGDDLVSIVVDSVINASKEHGFEIQNKDVIAITEAVTSISQKNYASLDQVATDVKNKMSAKTVGIVFPIMSRNRFSLILKAISRCFDKIYIQLSYPSDEVGNPLISKEAIYQHKVNVSKDVFTEKKFRKTFGEIKHPFTGMDYINFYKECCDGKAEVILANNPKAILKYTKYVITADIHTRKLSKQTLLDAGAKQVLGLDEILNSSVDGSGYNEKYGLLGSNISTDDRLKLFPRNATNIANAIQKEMKKRTGKTVECMIYGDGAFKDPVGGIWELADPVVSPGYTKGLEGTPSEIKLKYIVDTTITEKDKHNANEIVKNIIKNKSKKSLSDRQSQGTTPRRYVDLIGSLADLTSGSGDKGTPVVYIQNYFDNYSMD